MTIFKITEEVLSRLNGGDRPSSSRPSKQEVKNVLIQVVNSLIKSQHFNQVMQDGERIPDGLVLAEYDNIPVEEYRGVSRGTLPVMPVSLPLNMGVFHVGKSDDAINGFIPFQPGQMAMLSEEPMLSDILGQIGYEPRGKYIVFNSDITTNEEPITSVFALLVVKDVALYGDFELLPISADMEIDVIKGCYEFFAGQNNGEKKVDVIDKKEGGGK